jgi:threonyl-tRNA synthetase
MPIITLPDGNQKTFDHPVTIHQIAESIGSGLAKAALAGKIGDNIVDTTYIIDQDAAVSIITS